jgi:6-phosphofructokinase 1
MVVELMGRNAGWIALYAGVAGGGDAILIPEIPYDLRRVAEHIAERERLGARSSIVVVAEGAAPTDGSPSVVTPGHEGRLARLGGVGAQVAAALEDLTGQEARSVRLGHLQRGGEPTSFDRVLATRFGGKAVELILDGEFGRMVANRPPDIISVPLDDVVGRTRLVPTDLDLVRTARALGISFGDAGQDKAAGLVNC